MYCLCCTLLNGNDFMLWCQNCGYVELIAPPPATISFEVSFDNVVVGTYNVNTLGSLKDGDKVVCNNPDIVYHDNVGEISLSEVFPDVVVAYSVKNNKYYVVNGK